MDGVFLGESALGLLLHTLALLELRADRMRAPVCSLERWHYFNVVANRPTFHPKLAPRTRAIPLGKAAKCTSFLIPEALAVTYCGLRKGPIWCVYLFPGSWKVFHTDLSWQRCLLKQVRECQQPVCSQQERERKWAGALHRSPLVRKHSDLRVPAVGLWQENPVVRAMCSEIRQIQAQIHPPSPS